MEYLLDDKTEVKEPRLVSTAASMLEKLDAIQHLIGETPLLQHAIIDDVIHISQLEIVKGCHELLDEQFVFAGASSGASYSSIKKYFAEFPLDGAPPTVLFVCPDGGDAYLDTVYFEQWIETLKSSTMTIETTPDS